LRTVASFVSLSFFPRLKASQLPTRRRRRTLVILPPASHSGVVIRHPGRVGDAGDAVCQIVMRVRAVIDAITAGAANAPFKADDLIDAAIVLREEDPAAVEQREKIPVEIAGLLGDLIRDAVPAEWLLHKFAAIMIASDLGDAVELTERGKVIDDRLRRERWPCFTRCLSEEKRTY
jgi:hypothetical protein